MAIDFTPDAETQAPTVSPQSDAVSKINFTPDAAISPQPTIKEIPSGFGVPSDPDSLEYKAMTGSINPVSYAMQKAGKTGEMVGSGIMSAATALPKSAWNIATFGDRSETPPELTNAINSAKNYASGAISKGVDYLKNTNIWQAVQSAAVEHPEAAEDIKSLIGMSSLAAPGEQAFSKLSPPVEEIMAAKKAADLKETASDLYKKSAAQNVIFEPGQNEKLASDLERLKPEDPLKAAVWKKSGAADEIGMITGAMEHGPISLNGALDMRSRLNGLITKSFLAKDDVTAMHLQGVRDALNDAMLSNSGSGIWQEANHEFSKGATMQNLEELVAKASTKTQPANSLDTAINNFLQSRKSAGIRPDERAALEEVAKNSTSDEMKKAVGSRLAKYAGSAILSNFGVAGKVGGYLLGHFGANLARDSAMATKLEAMDKVYSAINSRTFQRVVTSPAASRALVPAGPVVNHMTDEQIAHAQARLKAIGNRSTPFSGGPVSPSMYSGSGGEQFGFSSGAGGPPTQYPIAGPAAQQPFPNPLVPEPPDLTKSFFKHKADGGKVNGKLGFKLKSKDK